MKYDKRDVTGKGTPKKRPYPYRAGGGPRDQQRRLQIMDQPDSSSETVKELRNQIAILTRELATRPRFEEGNEVSRGEFTAEDVDKEIRVAVVGAVKETEDRLKDKISKLNNNNKGLTDEIDRLKSELSSVIKQSDLGIKDSVTGYEKKIANLETKIRNRDEVIDEFKSDESREINELTKKVEELTMAVAAAQEIQVDIDPDRPQIEEVFVDPLEKDAGSKIEAHINIEDTSLDEKIKVDEKVNKLRDMLGKLPGAKK